MLLYLINDNFNNDIAAVRLELGNGTVPPQILNNNSVIDVLLIGDNEAGGDPLVCATQRNPCCGDMAFRAGNWYNPNETEVPIRYKITFQITRLHFGD